MEENSFIIQLVAKLNQQLTKKSINNDLKSLNDTMFVRVVAKLSKTISRRELNKQLKELNNLTVNVGTNVKVGKDTKEKIQKNIKMLQQSISDLEIGLKTSKINSDFQSVRNNVQKKINRTPVDLNLQIKKEKAISDIEYIAKKYSKLFSNASASQKFENILNSAYSISDAKDLSKVRNQISAFTSELKSNGLAAQSTGDKWRKLLDRSKELFSAASVIRTIFMQVKQAVSTTIGLDKVYTDLIKVNSELNRNDYPEYLSKCNQKAQELATTQKALIEGATEFSKSGYNLSTSDKLTEKSTVLANVGEMSASDSAKAIISGVQAYGEVDGYTDVSDKAQALIDKYNEIGNTASITTAEIAQGVQKVGSVFADANTSADEFISLLAAGNRQYQDADTLALGLRTSALRIRGCTAELEEMGEETEGVCTSASKLEEKIKGLTNIDGSGGVEILKSDGETFRSIYDIFLDISKVYKDMSDTDQSALLELIAGKHRASAISATLNNMTEAEEILQNSLNAAGSAQKEYDAYLESTEAHIQQFQAKLVETYSTFLNGDMISHVADLGTGILDLVNKTDLLKHTLIAIATIKIGQGISAIGGVIANTTKQMKTLGDALQQVKDLPLDAALRKSSIEQLGESTKSLTEKNLKLLLSQEQLSYNDKIRILRMHDLNAEQAKEKLEKLGLTNATNANTAANAANATSVNGLKGAFTGLTASIKATWTAMSALQKASIIFATISTVWSVVSSVVSSHNESVEEAKEKTKELADEALEEEKSLLSLIKRYNELDKTDRSTENTENIKNLNSEINNILGDQAEKIDLVNGKLDEQSDKLRRNLLQKLEDDKTEIDASVSVAKGKYDEGAEVGSFFDGWGNIGNVLKKYRATGISKNSKDGRIEVNKANVGAILKSLNTEQQIQQLEEWIELLNKADKDAGIGTYKDEISSLMGKLNEAKKIKSDYDKALSTQKENETKRKILNDSISGKINDFSAFKEYRNEIEKTYSDNSVFRDQLIEFIDNIYPEYAEKVKNTANAVKNSSPISFSEKWNKLKESEQNSLKKATLEGVLDKDSISQYQELADNFSLKQIRDEIISLIPLDDKLSQFIDDSEKLTSAYAEMKKNKTVSTKTLLGMPEGIRRLDGYTDFRDTVSNPKTSKADKKGAFEDIITEYLNANQTIIDASDETRDYVVNALKDAGITNAETLVDGVIHCKDTIKKVMTEVEDANETDVKNFAKACTSKNLNNTKLYNKIGKNTAYMLNQLKDKYAADVNNFGKALQSKLKAEKEYASAVLQLEVAANGNTSNSAMPNFFGKSYVSKDSEEYKNYAKKKKELDKVKKNYRKQLKKLQKDLKNVDITKIDFSPSTKDSSGKKKKDKTKKTKTEIDWLSRRLTRMQSIIDLTASKLQNLFSVKTKNENINDQIKETTALMKQYGVAADRYKKKANSIAAGKKKGKKKVKPLSKSIINQVKSGKITKKSYPKLIKKYGQSYADRINQYIDYYDKAQDAKKNKQDAKAKLRDLKQQGLQYYVDDYNAKAELAELRSGNAVGYQKQNSYVDTQLSYLQKSYKKKIAIAKLSKDKTEQDRLQEEYKAKETELKQNQVEHIKTDFENKIGFIRNDGQDVSNRISEIEARGDIVQSSYYSALNRYEQSSLSSMNTELQELKKKQGSFAMYSPEWYSLQSDIQSVENSISETNISIIENNKKIGELRQAMYDDIASRNNNAGSEAQFIAELLGDNLMNDKTGSLTKEGLGVLGTYGIELEANTNTALSYANQRKEIEQAIASYNSGNAHALDIYGSLKKAKEKLNEAIKNQQEATTAEYATMKKIYDMMVKRYETQLAYMKSIIDAKKQVLSMEKDLYDYQKNISSQTKNIAALEKQLAALKGDDSEEGRAKRSRLMVSLDEANQNLQDTEYDRYISDQENMLDNMYTQYEDLLSELEKDFEAVVKEGMNIINETASGISTTLNDIANKYGYNPSSDMSDILGVMKSSNDTIVKTLPETITNGLSSLGKIFQDGTNNIITNYSKEPPVSGNNSDATKGGGSGSGSNPGGGSDHTKERAEKNDLIEVLEGLSGKNDSTKPLKPAKPNKTYKSDLNKKLSKYGYVVKDGIGSHGLKYINMFAQALGVLQGDGSFSSEGVAYKALKKKYPSLKFRTGGIVRASGVSKDGDNIPVRVNPDETILTQDFTKMLPDAVDIMKDFVKVPDYIKVLQERSNIGNTNTFGDIVINAELPNVKDGHSFISEVQNEVRSQRFFERCVDDCITKGKLTSNIQRI